MLRHLSTSFRRGRTKSRTTSRKINERVLASRRFQPMTNFERAISKEWIVAGRFQRLAGYHSDRRNRHSVREASWTMPFPFPGHVLPVLVSSRLSHLNTYSYRNDGSFWYRDRDSFNGLRALDDFSLPPFLLSWWRNTPVNERRWLGRTGCNGRGWVSGGDIAEDRQFLEHRAIG